MSPLIAPLLQGHAASPIADRLRSFREQGVLGSVDVHVVDHLGALVGESDPDVLLALALAVRAPRNGHICIDLREVERFASPGEFDDGRVFEEPLSWPENRQDWIARVAASPLVRTPSEAGAAPFVLDGAVLYTGRYHTYQCRLAAALRRRVQSQLFPRDTELLQRGLEALFDPEGDAGLDRQRLGAAMAMLRGFTVISGGPGTGKTYTVRTVLTLLWAQWALDHNPGGEVAGPRVALVAPTGKAAARMEEALITELDVFLDRAAKVLPKGRTRDQLQTFLTTLQPSTIHRLLQFNPQQPTRFRHSAEKTVPHEVVVVDEASMIDFSLMAKLVDAIAPEARLILLGDKHQLASVEAGTVLADICGPSSVSQLTLSRGFVKELQTRAGLDVRSDQSVGLGDTAGPHDAIVQHQGNGGRRCRHLGLCRRVH